MSAVLASVDRPTIGRFELRHELGRGGQATVWLAFDPRLEREVALKLMSAEAGADPVLAANWLTEARSVSRLAHPNVVPLFEADRHAGRPYLVFEYVPGPTLAQHLKQRRQLAPDVAVPLAIGVLDALSAAHEIGVCHRDVKPSNILVDPSGRGRIMDFGIAARVDDPGHLDRIVGTPGYMSPEAAAGRLPSEAMDVFSLGLVLIEMLSGERLVADRDPHRAIDRVQRQDLALPTTLPASVDTDLRAVLRRAIERDPVRRWPDADAFREALRRWLAAPAGADDTPPDEAADPNQNATLEFLLRRMRHRSDFPALSDSIHRIQRLSQSENESIGQLSEAIMKDVALTQKLLRYVNSAQFAHFTGGIGTVSRAVALVGFAGIRSLATSLLLLEHLHDRAQASRLRDDFVRSLMAGMLASELVDGPTRLGEEAFLGAMFQGLGRMLAEFYFPEEAGVVRLRVASAPAEAPVSEDAAAGAVLGIDYQALGLGVARHWGLPDGLRDCMRRPVGEPPAELRSVAERLRWSARAANELSETLLQVDPSEARPRTSQLARRYARALGLRPGTIEAATDAARARLATMIEALRLAVPPQSPARRLLVAPPEVAVPTASASASASASAPAPAPASAPASAPSVDVERGCAAAAVVPAATSTALPVMSARTLAAGIQRITDEIAQESRIDTVLQLVLQTMHQAFGFRRLIFCLRDPKTETLTGRFGIGQAGAEVAPSFSLPLRQPTPDLFTAVCLKGADTLIADATLPHVASRLPAWYRGPVGASSFLLLPMQLRKLPLGLIYADRADGLPIALDEEGLALLRTLRNQAVLAFRQLGGG